MALNWDIFNPPGFNLEPFDTARVTDAKGAFFVEFEFLTDPFDPSQRNGADWLFANAGLTAAVVIRDFAAARVETQLGVRRRFFTRVRTQAEQAIEGYQEASNYVSGQTVQIGPGRAAAVRGVNSLWRAYVLLAAWHAANAADVPPFEVERLRYPSRAKGQAAVTRLIRGRPPMSNTPAYVPPQIPYTQIGGVSGLIPGNPPPGLGSQTEKPDLSGLIDALKPDEGGGETPTDEEKKTDSTALPLIIGGVVIVGLLLAATARK